MVSEARKRANAKYAKHNVIRKSIALFPTDHDIIDWLDSLDEPCATYIKRLIREDMERKARND